MRNSPHFLLSNFTGTNVEPSVYLARVGGDNFSSLFERYLDRASTLATGGGAKYYYELIHIIRHEHHEDLLEIALQDFHCLPESVKIQKMEPHPEI
jgi:GGDEF domain-containing protein